MENSIVVGEGVIFKTEFFSILDNKFSSKAAVTLLVDNNYLPPFSIELTDYKNMLGKTIRIILQYEEN